MNQTNIYATIQQAPRGIYGTIHAVLAELRYDSAKYTTIQPNFATIHVTSNTFQSNLRDAAQWPRLPPDRTAQLIHR